MSRDVHIVGNVSSNPFQWRETKRVDGRVCVYHSSMVREWKRCSKISQRVSLASDAIVVGIVLLKYQRRKVSGADVTHLSEMWGLRCRGIVSGMSRFKRPRTRLSF